MAATATKKKEKDVTISDKLEMLLKLQQIDTEIDRIRTIRGELPLEVQDLEDEVLGLTTINFLFLFNFFKKVFFPLNIVTLICPLM